MIAIDRQIYKQAKTGEITLEQLANYMLRNFPVYDIALSLAETINFEVYKPITISKEEFEQHFRIRGIRENGDAELRGRPRAEKPKTNTQP